MDLDLYFSFVCELNHGSRGLRRQTGKRNETKNRYYVNRLIDPYTIQCVGMIRKSSDSKDDEEEKGAEN